MGCFNWPFTRKQPHKQIASARDWPVPKGSETNGALSTSNPRKETPLVSTVAPTVSTVNSITSSNNNSAIADRVPGMLAPSLLYFPENCRRFRYSELEDATRPAGAVDGFDERLVIGEGGFGKVYRGTLADGSQVAIKRLDRLGMQGDKEFGIEVSLLGTLRHVNIVALRGVCVEGDHRCMLTDLCAKGSLRVQLDLREKGLGWAARIHVALGAALGLAYLHDHAEPPVVHRDFKTSNILVDDKFNGQVADFGLARRMKSRAGTGIHEPLPPECTVVMGTFGYVAPEYARTGTLNEKSDVYAFGVVLLEVLTSAEVVDTQRPLANRNLVDWLYTRLQDIAMIKEVVDPVLGDIDDMELASFCELATWCLEQDGAKRPRMSQVADVLRDIYARHEGEAMALSPPTSPTANALRPEMVQPPIVSSSEGVLPGRQHTYQIPGAPSGHAALRSLSYEATIVVLDGDGKALPAAAIRDPFATSLAEFTPSNHQMPLQKGYSFNGGGANPFATLSQWEQQPGANAAVPVQPNSGQQQMPAGKDAALMRHQRNGSFSESLDTLALRLGLSGPMGKPGGFPSSTGGGGFQPQLPSQPEQEAESEADGELHDSQVQARVQQQLPSNRAAASPGTRSNSLPPAASALRHAPAGKPQLAFGRPVPTPAQPRRLPQPQATAARGARARASLPPAAQRTQQEQQLSDQAVPQHSPPNSQVSLDGIPYHVQQQQQFPAGSAQDYRHSPAQQPYQPNAPPVQSVAQDQIALPTHMLTPQQYYYLQQQQQAPHPQGQYASVQQQQQQQQPQQQQQQQQQPYQQQQAYQQQYGVGPAQHGLPPRIQQQEHAQQLAHQPSATQQIPRHVVEQGLQAQHEMWGQQQQQKQVSGWYPRQQQLLSPSSPPWIQPTRHSHQRISSGGIPSPAATPANPFHSAEPCMVCGKETREWHLAPCGHAVGCRPCVLRIARVGDECPSCGVHATGMLHQRFVHATPTPAGPQSFGSGGQPVGQWR